MKMKTIHLLLITFLSNGEVFTCACLKSQSVEDDSVDYVAAVVEYVPFSKWPQESGQSLLEHNVNAYVEFAQNAKIQGADIIVFPEYGLTGSRPSTDNPLSFLYAVSQQIPDPTINDIPCFSSNNNHAFQVLKKLSCTARDSKMYLAVNLIEWLPSNSSLRKDKFFNTNVVFNRRGSLIARYRKKHPFLEEPIEKGEEHPSTALFSTDFGVTFSLQICFDILYTDPAIFNIDLEKTFDVIMSTAWIDELPFLTAPQIFSGWSRGLGVNLLVSNYHSPQKGGLGSGIFLGASNSDASYIYDTRKSSSLIVRRVRTKKPCSNLPVTPSPIKELNTIGTLDTSSHYIIHENLLNYTSEPLKISQNGDYINHTLCHEELCCEAVYLHTDDVGYRLISYSGTIAKGGGVHEMFVQECAVVWCSGGIDTCADVNEPRSTKTRLRLLSLRGDFESKYIFPSILRLNFTLVDSEDWDFDMRYDSSKWRAKIGVKSSEYEQNILSASLFVRVFTKDPEQTF